MGAVSKHRYKEAKGHFPTIACTKNTTKEKIEPKHDPRENWRKLEGINGKSLGSVKFN